MKSTKELVGDLFGAPVQNMTYPHYLQYMNEQGKITARSIMDLCSVLLTKIEEYEHNFEQIEQILGKLVDQKIEKVPDMLPPDPLNVQNENSTSIFPCDQCDKILTTQSGLVNHKRIKHQT